MLCQAGPSQNGRIFLENRYSRGANLQVRCRQDELGLATPTSRRPQWSRLPLGRASFLLGSVGKGVQYCYSWGKRGSSYRLFGSSPLFRCRKYCWWLTCWTPGNWLWMCSRGSGWLTRRDLGQCPLTGWIATPAWCWVCPTNNMVKIERDSAV